MITKEDVEFVLRFSSAVRALTQDGQLAAVIEEASLKSAEAEAALAELSETRAEIAEAADAAEALKSEAEAKYQHADERLALAFKGMEDVEIARAAQRAERHEFDNWMADLRQKLAEDQAKVASGLGDIRAREAVLAERLSKVDELNALALAKLDEALALKSDYEAKIDALKKSVL